MQNFLPHLTPHRSNPQELWGGVGGRGGGGEFCLTLGHCRDVADQRVGNYRYIGRQEIPISLPFPFPSTRNPIAIPMFCHTVARHREPGWFQTFYSSYIHINKYIASPCWNPHVSAGHELGTAELDQEPASAWLCCRWPANFQLAHQRSAASSYTQLRVRAIQGRAPRPQQLSSISYLSAARHKIRCR